MEREEGGRLHRRAAAMVAPVRIAPFRRLWAADVISLLGDWAGRLALTVIVLERTGSPAWAAGVTAVSLAGFVGIGQLLATLADRRSRLAVMLSADIVRAVLFVLMLLDLPVGALLALAFLAGVATPAFEAARSAAIPDIVPEESYGDALALANLSVQASVVAGNLLGGGLLLIVSPEAALAANAVTYLVSALLLLGLKGTQAATGASAQRTMGSSLREGAANLLGDPLLRRALLVITVVGALGTIDEALVVPYAARIGLTTGALGLLAASVPVGTIVGTMLVPTRGGHQRLLRGAAVGALVAAAASAPLFWLEVRGIAAFVAFLLSGGMFAVSVPANIVIGSRLARDNRASAMGIVVGVLMGGQALAAALGGLVAAVVGPSAAIAGALGLICAFSAWSAVTTPYEAKHLARRRHTDGPPVVIDLAAAEGGVVVDLVALENQQPAPPPPALMAVATPVPF